MTLLITGTSVLTEWADANLQRVAVFPDICGSGAWRDQETRRAVKVSNKIWTRAQLWSYLFERIVGNIDRELRKEPDWAGKVQDYVDVHWIWTGSLRNGRPAVGYASNPDVHVTRALYCMSVNFVDIVLLPGLRKQCGVKRCINPHHYFIQDSRLLPADFHRGTAILRELSLLPAPGETNFIQPKNSLHQVLDQRSSQPYITWVNY